LLMHMNGPYRTQLLQQLGFSACVFIERGPGHKPETALMTLVGNQIMDMTTVEGSTECDGALTEARKGYSGGVQKETPCVLEQRLSSYNRTLSIVPTTVSYKLVPTFCP
jgi:hypothetical protein